MNKRFALVDCNNFFVSCERIFRPDLEGRPVVVLSSNDGCAVARSNEAKALGIPMGAPAFKYKELFKRERVVCFSANFELYGDISSRITQLLTSITPHIEVYSVDESFLDLEGLDIADYSAWGQLVRKRILQYVGVPVSVGVTSSKTLAKLAADRAKKMPELASVLSFIGQNQLWIDDYLRQTPVRDIWGIGWRLAPKLVAEGIHTALDLRHLAPRRAHQLMGVNGRQIVAELNGTACHPLQHFQKPQQMIMRGRQFGEDTGSLLVIEAAIASLTNRAARHLRQEQQLARQATVMLRTNRHRPGYQVHQQTVRFATPTSDTGAISRALTSTLKVIINPRQQYHRADVFLTDFIPSTALQTDLLGTVSTGQNDRENAKMQAFDQLNTKFGKGSIRLAAEDLSQAWQPRHRLGSPHYTSSWQDLPEARGI